ncbi:phage portal protein [Paraburkholderia bengalensis]|uniref:Phage portal protein n=1 Tax=Paraburkholderia bengalensis TaxID=2747562 RepID=A0ABU8IS32_9BURK
MSKEAFANAQARARVPGSPVLNAWRAQHGPETTGRINNLNETRQSLTVQELANIIGGGAISNAGPVVNETTATKVSAVYACVALIAGAISTLPMPVYERTPTGRARVEHPYWWLLNEQPEPDVSAAVFWEYMVAARLFYGDCFAEIVRPSFRSNGVSAFRAHHPLRVFPFRDSAGDLWYRVQPLVGAEYVLHPADMIHVPSLGYDGIRSPSPITYAARQAVGTSLAAAEYSARFFSNGARPDFALMTPGDITEEQARLLRATWGERHSGVANAHLPAVLTGGLQVKELTMTPVDAQILETSKWNLEEICRTLGVPPFMVGSTEKTTSWGSGVENMSRGFVKFTLLRDLVKFNQEFNRKLWPTRQRLFVEFDVSGMERGDLQGENAALRIAMGSAGTPGWMTPNEVRHIKLLPPIEGGDVLFSGVNPSAGAASTEPASPTETAPKPAGQPDEGAS